MEHTKEVKNKKKEEVNSEVLKLKEKCSEYENNWKRAVADYHNLKKRTEEERIAFFKFSNKELLTDFLAVLDNFEAVSKHLEDTGLNISVSFLRDLLKRNGVEEMNILNTDFDSSKEEAIELIDGEKNKVIEVITKGYTLNGDVLRVARVKVGKGK